MTRRIQVIVGDGLPLFRDALGRLVRQRVQFELLGEVDDGRAALEAIGRLRPHVAILSAELPQLDGLRVLDAVVRDGLPTRVLLLTEPSTDAYRMIEHGAAGCLTRSADEDLLCHAIRTAAGSGTVMAAELHAELARAIRLRRDDERPVLSRREREVLRLTADGLRIAAIADRLFIAPRTVRSHLAHAYEKLGVSDRAAAVAEAMRHGLLE